ncbi:hypothetical protein HMPREF9141_0515 [Prevotella multiformis DSM 16608]|uniref:Uncharacterized protein n=1 Tax=Prevotella multiformis DSM 16608 TaxID=888743 RepID=F0F4J9_9BACT|nr:hypothetical protein HMPREF9141_0515 [Prevotella multiformis DSM 16608]
MNDPFSSIKILKNKVRQVKKMPVNDAFLVFYRLLCPQQI